MIYSFPFRNRFRALSFFSAIPLIVIVLLGALMLVAQTV